MEYLIEYLFRGDKRSKLMKDGPLFENFKANKDVSIIKIKKLDPSSTTEDLSLLEAESEHQEDDVYDPSEEW